jgi:hypothetical protein
MNEVGQQLKPINLCGFRDGIKELAENCEFGIPRCEKPSSGPKQAAEKIGLRPG